MRSRMHPEIARALAPFAPPDSVVHQTAEEAADSEIDRWRDEAREELERRDRERYEWALEQQQRYLTATKQLGGL